MDFKAGTLSKVDRIKEAKKDLYSEKKKIEPLAVVVEESVDLCCGSALKLSFTTA